jgi:Notch 1
VNFNIGPIEYNLQKETNHMFSLKHFLLASLATIIIIIPGSGQSVVSQIDGTIVPTGPNLQIELDNQGESLDAIEDAYIFPQIFMPSVNADGDRIVIFTDIQELAGYENTFGWYNVGKPNELHKILECAANPGDSVSVNFDEEFTKNKWDGGFIAFYLITPQGNSAGNCGDFDPPENFGHIYYTEPENNGDGDYVHNIVFTSTLDPKTFYFAFEDLYRGGDNDFTDMTIKVMGLVPPCIPDPEICDGEDNDCDGEIDENPDDAGGSCGSDIGECEFGTYVCNDGVIECEGDTPPSSELCDGLDNDCDGTDDNSPIDEGDVCGTSAGTCSPGTTICMSGNLECQGETGPSSEICDGYDNDCDGTNDNNLIDDGSPCGSDTGECQMGVTQCSSGSLVCQGSIGSTAEICDGLDNDCNGTDDNDPIDVGSNCGVDTGECQSGITVCTSGSISCSGSVGPVVEICDNLDNDCDGISDNNPSDAGAACGTDTGECISGVETCISGAITCAGAISSTPEVCDNLDNDCDGTTDNNLTDDGGECGTDTGECQSGFWLCSGGALTCTGAMGPSPEICDNLDNDCNGITDDAPVDVGTVCGSDVGICNPGLTICVDGTPLCLNETVPEEEICDGLDNDCNGQVDDGDPGGGEVCGVSDEGVCEFGITHCIAGALICEGSVDPGEEICDGIDNNCDGLNDNGAVCPEGSECIDGSCKIFCGGGEFSCPGGTECVEDYCVPNECWGVECPDGHICRDGDCINLCDGINCDGDEICLNGICLEDDCYSLGCEDGMQCIDYTCTADPCSEIECGENQFCSIGTCVTTCERVQCGIGTKCQNGECVVDLCHEIECGFGKKCQDGNCVDDQCVNINCIGARVCEDGICIDDKCDGVSCPHGGVCTDGECSNHPDYIPEIPGDKISSNGRSIFGCSTSSNSQKNSKGILVLLTFLIFVVIFKKRGQLPRIKRFNFFMLLLISLAFFTFSGCNVEYYQIPGDEGHMPTDDGGSDSDVVECIPTNDGTELCDEIDNNCDGRIDEGFDLKNDINNCGTCGQICDQFGSFNQCLNGECIVVGCAPGFFNLNDDMSDGCEYACIPTSGGLEICDGQDNDCDGHVDEGFDKTTDTMNCGDCGTRCAFTNAASQCSNGICEIGDCNSGFYNLNGFPADGCEYACIISNDGTELCDGLDNDCNGTIDEGVDTDSDPMNCGSCWNQCNRPNSTIDCVSGTCTMVVCDTGFFNANNDITDGCELPCTISNDGTEICDGIDNNCDAVIDNNPVDSGGNCGSDTGECSHGTEICSGGSIICSGSIGSSAEICDNLDNDCDGVVDNDPYQVGNPCGTALGLCEMGSLICSSGSLKCSGGVVAITETCDGLDNDCDGIADNNLTDTGGACGSNTGECSQGLMACSSGTLYCSGEVGPKPEICDTLDNDCNNIPDDLTIDTGDICGSGVGTCSIGTTICSSGSIVCNGDVGPEAEVCDNLDNDCNGLIDDGTPVGVGITCGTTNTGECSYGSTICSNGTIECSGNIEPESWDVCDTLDTDCDGTYDPLGCMVCSTTDIRLDATSPAGSENSIHVDMDALDDTIHVVWLDTRGTYADIYHTCSDDGGATWSTDTRIDSGDSDSVKPRVLIDPSDNGIAYLVYEDDRSGDDRDIYLRRVTSCSGATAVYDPEMRLDSGDVDSLNIDLVADGLGDVTLVWEEFVAGSGTEDPFRNIYMVNSSNFGLAFSSMVRVNQTPADSTTAYATTPKVSMNTNGRLFIVWTDLRNGAGDIYLNYSDDGGSSFATPSDIRIDTDTPGDGASKFPQIEVSGTTGVHVVWQDLRSDTSSDIYYNYSLDGGANWNPSDNQLDSDGGISNSYEPSIVKGSGTNIHVAWQDFRAGLPDIMVATSQDGGVNFSGAVSASENSGFVSEPRIDVDGTGKVYVVFVDDRDGRRDLFFNYSLDDGIYFQPQDIRMNTDSPSGLHDSFSPKLSVGPSGFAFIVWIDTRSNDINGDIYFNIASE